jgi:hypothetical protein
VRVALKLKSIFNFKAEVRSGGCGALMSLVPEASFRSPRPAGIAACRCLCGSLLARLVPGGVEIKCRRCKRTQVIPLEAPR